MICPCGSGKTYDSCCGPVIEGDSATSAEVLMRSRYTAFATNNMPYVYLTYSAQQKRQLNPAEFDEPNPTQWCGLKVLHSEKDTVEFRAFFTEQGRLFEHHERSYFLQEENKWRYDIGDIVHNGKAKLKRNDLCICNSGKKYKHCCINVYR